MPPKLYGFKYSVYTRIVRMVLHEKQVQAEYHEVNPFEDLSEGYKDLHPFGRVPAFDHSGFRLYETAAITHYIDDAFPGPDLQPTDPQARARMMQVIRITDAYAYWPLVRQVFSHAVFRPAMDLLADAKAVAEGMKAATPVLNALNDIAEEGFVLTPKAALDLGALHFAPMLGYFVQAPNAQDCLAQTPALARWWADFSKRDSFSLTEPGLPGL